ncbi:putative quinol monooxygenase [Legionella quinlivanii]|uniref:putative quinol monooxygenase n=1 Tax=Legionella quinlivanii TaxID=45073 RepID=UPI002242FCC1|nr:hypothetical protein [Legionella quinlivanii]MCW8451371.1 hypothetical protein [Legionella quinlivanii]
MKAINEKTIKDTTYIPMISNRGAEERFEEFLKQGAQIVNKTEPNTALWFALKQNNHFAIFDVFFNKQGREEHFAGLVANALKENSLLVSGGWEQGVLANINNYDLIASSHFDKDKVLTAQEASYIYFKAKSGKSHELESFLKEGAKLINATEPGTYFWLALKTDNNTYAIFDAFQDTNAQKAHFSGKVAAALQNNANELIEGGWEQGVLAHVSNFQIITVV